MQIPEREHSTGIFAGRGTKTIQTSVVCSNVGDCYKEASTTLDPLDNDIHYLSTTNERIIRQIITIVLLPAKIANSSCAKWMCWWDGFQDDYRIVNVLVNCSEHRVASVHAASWHDCDASSVIQCHDNLVNILLPFIELFAWSSEHYVKQDSIYIQ